MSTRQIHLNVLGNKCVLCGSTENLEIHHKDKKRGNNNINNLQLLCKTCHEKKHMEIDGLGITNLYLRTNMFIIDAELWAWAQYRAKILKYNSVSEYLFDLIKLDKQENVLKGE